MKININGTEIEVQDDIVSQAIEKKEAVKISNDKIMLFTSDDYNTRIENLKKDEYKKGRKEGVEIEWKETKRKLGIEIEGKNGDEILDAFRLKVLADAKVEPNQKIKDLEADKIKLQQNLTKLETEKTELSNQFAQKEKEGKINSLIFSSIPEKAVSETLTRNDIASVFKGNGYQVDIVDEKEVVKANGEILKHGTTLEPLKLSDVMSKFVTEKGFLKQDGGRGEGDKTKDGTPGTLEAFEKEMKEKNITMGSEAYAKEMGERIKNKTLKI
jgi:hypothetical protein